MSHQKAVNSIRHNYKAILNDLENTVLNKVGWLVGLLIFNGTRSRKDILRQTKIEEKNITEISKTRKRSEWRIPHSDLSETSKKKN